MIANLTGDAYADIIMGSARGDGQANSLADAGEVYVLYGKPSGWSRTLSASTIGGSNAGFVFYGKSTSALTGYSLAAGRLFGSGTDTLVVGVPSSEASAGKVQVLLTVNACQNKCSVLSELCCFFWSVHNHLSVGIECSNCVI